MVTLRVEGKPVDFLVDTGATYSVLKQLIVNLALGLSETQRILVRASLRSVSPTDCKSKIQINNLFNFVERR